MQPDALTMKKALELQYSTLLAITTREKKTIKKLNEINKHSNKIEQ
jgi:hypothetical protein